MTVRAIYENGVFKPTQPVNLPDKSAVEFDPKLLDSAQDDDAANEQNRKEIVEILSRRYCTGQTDTAERHNELEP